MRVRRTPIRRANNFLNSDTVVGDFFIPITNADDRDDALRTIFIDTSQRDVCTCDVTDDNDVFEASVAHVFDRAVDAFDPLRHQSITLELPVFSSC